MLPYVSIIIPAYNAQDTLHLCLDSIMRLDYPTEKLEVILVDNNSTDATAKIAREYPIAVLKETEAQSSYAARNRGIEIAKGELIAFTDADCVITKQWLKMLLSSCANSQIGCFAGEIKAYHPRTLAEHFAEHDEENHNQKRELDVGYRSAVNTANVAFRRGIFQKIGLFNGDLKSGGDAELTWRLIEDGEYKIVYEPEAIVYHKHRSSLGGLWLQYRKYGEGIGDLVKLYPESCGSTIGFVNDIFAFGFKGIRTFPKNMYLYHRGRIDKIDVWFYFLKAFCRFGLVVGKIQAGGKKMDGSISWVLITRYLFSKLLLRIRTRLLS
jgi:cellulose synthase/poly-beta-1,6-N-acetylglucosamine synthase-like glycosyltransferase